MGSSYFSSARERRDYEREMKAAENREEARIADKRAKFSAKIVMAVVDRIVNEIIRPGPAPEERECYEMAGELRALNPALEKLVKQIIDTEDGVE